MCKRNIDKNEFSFLQATKYEKKKKKMWIGKWFLLFSFGIQFIMKNGTKWGKIYIPWQSFLLFLFLLFSDETIINMRRIQQKKWEKIIFLKQWQKKFLWKNFFFSVIKMRIFMSIVLEKLWLCIQKLEEENYP